MAWENDNRTYDLDIDAIVEKTIGDMVDLWSSAMGIELPPYDFNPDDYDRLEGEGSNLYPKHTTIATNEPSGNDVVDYAEEQILKVANYNSFDLGELIIGSRGAQGIVIDKGVTVERTENRTITVKIRNYSLDGGQKTYRNFEEGENVSGNSSGISDVVIGFFNTKEASEGGFEQSIPDIKDDIEGEQQQAIQVAEQNWKEMINNMLHPVDIELQDIQEQIDDIWDRIEEIWTEFCLPPGTTEIPTEEEREELADGSSSCIWARIGYIETFLPFKTTFPSLLDTPDDVYSGETIIESAYFTWGGAFPVVNESETGLEFERISNFLFGTLSNINLYKRMTVGDEIVSIKKETLTPIFEQNFQLTQTLEDVSENDELRNNKFYMLEGKIILLYNNGSRKVYKWSEDENLFNQFFVVPEAIGGTEATGIFSMIYWENRYWLSMYKENNNRIYYSVPTFSTETIPTWDEDQYVDLPTSTIGPGVHFEVYDLKLLTNTIEGNVYSTSIETLYFDNILPTIPEIYTPNILSGYAVVNDKLYEFQGRWLDINDNRRWSSFARVFQNDPYSSKIFGWDFISGLNDTFDRAECTSTSVGTDIYNLYGRSANTSWRRHIRKYDTLTDTYTGNLSTFPKNMWSHNIHYYSFLNKLYVYGGYEYISGTTYRRDYLYVFDIASPSWTLTSTTGESPSPKAEYSSAIVGDYLYVFGGDSGIDFDTDKEAYKLNINTLEWTELPGCPIHTRGAITVVYDNKIWFFGNRALDDSTGVEYYYYDISTNSYSDIWTFPTGLESRAYGCGGLINGNEIIIAGGYEPDAVQWEDYRNDTWRFLPDTDTWEQMHDREIFNSQGDWRDKDQWGDREWQQFDFHPIRVTDGNINKDYWTDDVGRDTQPISARHRWWEVDFSKLWWLPTFNKVNKIIILLANPTWSPIYQIKEIKIWGSKDYSSWDLLEFDGVPSNDDAYPEFSQEPNYYEITFENEEYYRYVRIETVQSYERKYLDEGLSQRLRELEIAGGYTNFPTIEIFNDPNTKLYFRKISGILYGYGEEIISGRTHSKIYSFTNDTFTEIYSNNTDENRWGVIKDPQDIDSFLFGMDYEDSSVRLTKHIQRAIFGLDRPQYYNPGTDNWYYKSSDNFLILFNNLINKLDIIEDPVKITLKDSSEIYFSDLQHKRIKYVVNRDYVYALIHYDDYYRIIYTRDDYEDWRELHLFPSDPYDYYNYEQALDSANLHAYKDRLYVTINLYPNNNVEIYTCDIQEFTEELTYTDVSWWQLPKTELFRKEVNEQGNVVINTEFVHIGDLRIRGDLTVDGDFKVGDDYIASTNHPHHYIVNEYIAIEDIEPLKVVKIDANEYKIEYASHNDITHKDALMGISLEEITEGNSGKVLLKGILENNRTDSYAWDWARPGLNLYLGSKGDINVYPTDYQVLYVKDIIGTKFEVGQDVIGTYGNTGEIKRIVKEIVPWDNYSYQYQYDPYLGWDWWWNFYRYGYSYGEGVLKGYAILVVKPTTEELFETGDYISAIGVYAEGLIEKAEDPTFNLIIGTNFTEKEMKFHLKKGLLL